VELGNYVNIFPVAFESTHFKVAQIERRKYPSLKELRPKLKNSSVYAVEDKVYGFGSDFDELTRLDFIEVEVSVQDIPKLTTLIIKDGISRHVIELGYELEYGFVNRVFDRSNPLHMLINEVQLFNGFEFRPLYLFDRVSGKIFFSVIIDLRHKLELEGKPSSYAKIKQYVIGKYGTTLAYQAMLDIKFKTGDLTPFGQRNPEASRFRLEKILGFVKSFSRVTLYDGTKMYLSQGPIRIVGGEY
jgi:hypothetical protein